MSPIPIIGEADVAASADDDVAEQANAEQIGCFAQATRDLDVLLRRGRVT